MRLQLKMFFVLILLLIAYRLRRLLFIMRYMFIYYEGRYSNTKKGKFSVKYHNGRLSENMCYQVAKEYASIFGGYVLCNYKTKQNETKNIKRSKVQ